MRFRRAFTLIEMLIVVAILAIMAASLIAVVVAPLKEQRYAEQDLEFEAGTATFFAALVEDTHSAHEVIRSGPGFALQLQDNRAALYYIDGERNLRRALLPREEAMAILNDNMLVQTISVGAALIGSMEELDAIPQDDGRWRFHIRASRPLLDQEFILDRSATLRIGVHP